MSDSDNVYRVDSQVDESGTPESIDEEFDFRVFRLPDNYATLEAEKQLVAIPVRKPRKQDFVRVHPEYRQRAAILPGEVMDESEGAYLIVPHLAAEFPTFCQFVELRLAVTRNHTPFIWPLRIPGDRVLLWHTSALEIAKKAEQDWLRISSNRESGSYEANVALGDFEDPRWPDQSFEDLLKLAFKNRLIRTVEHPVMQRLRGEA